MDEPQVKSGAVIALRLFDIAYSIDLKLAECLWAERIGGTTSRSKLNTAPSKAVAFDVPPVLLSLGTISVARDGRQLAASDTARLYDYGVVAHSQKVHDYSLDWMEFKALANAVDQLNGRKDKS